MLPNKQPNTSIIGVLKWLKQAEICELRADKCLVPEENEHKVGVRQFLLDQLDGAGQNAVSCSLLLLDVWGFVNGSNNLPRSASFLQVCDIYLKYKLPLLIMPPAGVFYPALLSMDSVNLNQLCYIMYRYYKWCGLQGFLLSFLKMKLLGSINLKSILSLLM